MLDVAAALGAVLARPGPRDQTLIGGQHQRRALAREVAFAQAATTNTPQDKSPSSQDMHKPIIIFCRLECDCTFDHLAQCTTMTNKKLQSDVSSRETFIRKDRVRVQLGIQSRKSYVNHMNQRHINHHKNRIAVSLTKSPINRKTNMQLNH